MRLKRLEMVGFKSFAQKTAVELNPGITAVVGPNGCGKSNIVDALRWAMGEQSARHLRGHLMEDVIFNGSESLPATGMAEVSLTFDNEDSRGPLEYNNYSEIMVTRRLFRSGESEYAINKVLCRLKDVIELFLGTGIGSKAYSIVEQGRVEELVNSKPEDRRALIEEAAGTSKFKSRKLVAERKLERSQQNLLRVGDIVREIERQIRAMELQAKKAERFRALKAELKEKDLAYGALQHRGLTEEIERGRAHLADAENRLAQHLASLQAKESESEARRLAMMEAEKSIGDRQELLYQQKVQIQADEQRIDFYKKDLNQLDGAETEARAALRQLEEKLGTASREIEELNTAKESYVQLSLFEESFLREKEAELENLQSRIQSLEKELERQKETLIDAANQTAYLKNAALAKTKRREEIALDLARCQEQRSIAVKSFEVSERKRVDTGSALKFSLDQARERDIEAAQVNAAIQTVSRAKQEQERRTEALKEQIQKTRSALLSLEDLQKNYEGCQEGVRAIMLKSQQAAAPNGIYGLVADVIEAPAAYEKALTAVLGDRLQYVIVKGHEEGVEAIEFLKREATGRGSFIPLCLSRKQENPLPLGESEVLAPLMEMLTVKDGYRDVAEYLLSDVVVVRDLMSGLALWNRNGFYCTLVTPEGDLIDPMGIVTGGSEASLEGSFLAQRRRIRELQTLLAELEARLPPETREIETLTKELEQANAKRSILSAEIHRSELERVRLELEHLSAGQESDRHAQTSEALAQEHDDLTSALDLLNDEIRQSNHAVEALVHDQAARELALAQTQADCLELRDALESVEAAVTQSRIRNAALGEKNENTRSNLESRLKSLEETNGEIAARRHQIAGIQHRRAKLKNSAAGEAETLEKKRADLQEFDNRLQSERQNYRNLSRGLTEIEESIKELRPLGEACQEERNRLQLLLAEKRLNLQHLAENIREKYDVDLQTYSAGFQQSDISRDELIGEINELRGRLERMGEVNMAAIGEYEELTARFQFMSRQKEDLEKSIADLQHTIIKLNRVCRLRFKESFEAINEKFESIFPRLFRGGRAKLALTDDNDYLETGVDIIVQPPGKKLQSITLLSGGEKALTAVSLLFAIFLTKPSPFCFLDEVDAPLDDANIERFNELVKEMSEFSQFVLVTHNKKTMQAAEILYGITMAEPGVSKIVSVKMS